MTYLHTLFGLNSSVWYYLFCLIKFRIAKNIIAAFVYKIQGILRLPEWPNDNFLDGSWKYM